MSEAESLGWPLSGSQVASILNTIVDQMTTILQQAKEQAKGTNKTDTLSLLVL